MDQSRESIKNLKDFLYLYNGMTETCFSRCVDNLYTRKLDSEETKCVENCSQTFINFNNKIMQYFITAQSKIMNKRMKDLEQAQQAALLKEHNVEAENANQISTSS